MGQPAARISDMHTCPMSTGPVPHVGGPIAAGAPTVLIGGLPAARVGDMATCVGPPDTIVKGSASVLICGMPAARMGDSTAHGGVIVAGCPTVLIGGVRDLVNLLTKDEIRNLPSATRNWLMRELLSDNLSDDDKKALKKIYSVKFTDPEFEKLDAQKRADMVEKLKNDKDIVDAKKNWATMSKEERFKILQKAAAYQDEASGTNKTILAEYDQAPENGSIEYGYYQHGDGKLHINTNPAALDDFNESLDTVIHENGHHYQYMLIDDLNAGKIKPGDPLYNQAETFQLNNQYYTLDNPEYETQPMENHSRTTGAAAAGAIP